MNSACTTATLVTFAAGSLGRYHLLGVRVKRHHRRRMAGEASSEQPVPAPYVEHTVTTRGQHVQQHVVVMGVVVPGASPHWSAILPSCGPPRPRPGCPQVLPWSAWCCVRWERSYGTDEALNGPTPQPRELNAGVSHDHFFEHEAHKFLALREGHFLKPGADFLTEVAYPPFQFRSCCVTVLFKRGNPFQLSGPVHQRALAAF